MRGRWETCARPTTVSCAIAPKGGQRPRRQAPTARRAARGTGASAIVRFLDGCKRFGAQGARPAALPAHGTVQQSMRIIQLCRGRVAVTCVAFAFCRLKGGATIPRGLLQYGMTPADSAKPEVTMRFPVKNCYSKVIVSESLEILCKYYYYYYIREYTYLTIYGKLPNLVVRSRSDLF